MEATTLATALNGNERRPDGDEYRGRDAYEFGCFGGREQERWLHGASIACWFVD